MAILRMLNYKNATSERMRKVLDYCLDSDKSENGCHSAAISNDAFSAFYLNRRLHCKEEAKRWFKVVIVSLEQIWEDGVDKQTIESLLEKFIGTYAEQGWQTAGAVHYDSRHPHFHLVIDTCNVNTGRQFSQSRADLSELKHCADQLLKQSGIDEKIRQNSLQITVEDETYEIGEEEYAAFKRTVLDDDHNSGDSTDRDSYETDDRIAAFTHIKGVLRPAVIYSQFRDQRKYPYNQSVRQENSMMAYAVTPEEKATGRQMTYSVTPEEKTTGRQMTYSVTPEEKAKGRQMAYSVTPEEKAKGRLMVQSIFKKR